LFVLTITLIINQKINSSDIQRNPERYEEAVKKVISSMTTGLDVSPLFSDMIMVLLLFYDMI